MLALHSPFATLYAFAGMIMLWVSRWEDHHDGGLLASRQRNEGIEPELAIYNAAVIRFRPIMMTTMSALMGTLPIAIGWGSSSEGRKPLGLAVVGGLVVSQAVTLYVTPVLYVYLDRLGSRIAGKRRKPIAVPAE